jgi:hypothetical protein
MLKSGLNSRVPQQRPLLSGGFGSTCVGRPTSNAAPVVPVCLTTSLVSSDVDAGLRSGGELGVTDGVLRLTIILICN